MPQRRINGRDMTYVDAGQGRAGGPDPWDAVRLSPLGTATGRAWQGASRHRRELAALLPRAMGRDRHRRHGGRTHRRHGAPVPVHLLGDTRGGSSGLRCGATMAASAAVADLGRPGRLTRGEPRRRRRARGAQSSCAIAPSASPRATSMARSAASAMPSAALRLGQGARDRQGDDGRQRPHAPRSERASAVCLTGAPRCERSGRRRCRSTARAARPSSTRRRDAAASRRCAAG
jgi:hypothetical protein